MDRALALSQLGLNDQDWGPCYGSEFTHAQFTAKWRGSVACPSEADIESAWVSAKSTLDKDATNAPIKAQIASLDTKRIRPLAEGDTVFLAKLNDQIKILRAQLK